MYIVPDAAPPRLTSSIISSTSITLSWSRIVCLRRNGKIISYDIHVVTNGTVDGALITWNINTAKTSFTVDRLLPFTEYRFQVAGVNVNGIGPYSDFIGPIITDEEGCKNSLIYMYIINLPNYYTVPGPVSGLKAGNVKFYTLELLWSPPEVPNGVITSYDIIYTLDGNSFRTDRLNATSNPQTYTISNMELQTNISSIIVTARTQVGPGASSLFSDSFITLTEPRKCIVVKYMFNRKGGKNPQLIFHYDSHRQLLSYLNGGFSRYKLQKKTPSVPRIIRYGCKLAAQKILKV